MGTWFQAHEQCALGDKRFVFRFHARKTIHFRMRAAELLMPAFADNTLFPVGFAYQYRSHHRIGCHIIGSKTGNL